jgi:hypothetical protein
MAKDIAVTTDALPATFRPWQLLWPTALLVAAACLVTGSATWLFAAGILRGGGWTYIAGTTSLSWFDTGFARRELAGTVIRLFTPDPLIGTAWFGFITYAAFALAGIWLCCRPSLGFPRRLFLGALLLAILVRLSADIGRTDPAIMALGIGAALAASRAHWILCASFVFIALLVHETGLIELAPLVAVVAWGSGSWRRWQAPNAVAGAIILASAVGLYAATLHPHYDLFAATAKIHARFPHPEDADTAIYQNLVGPAALRLANCFIRRDTLYPVQVGDGLFLCLLFAVGLQPTRWRLMLAACALPFLALSAIAIDVGRWATFAAYIAFVAAAILPAPAVGRKAGLTAGALALVAYALLIASPRPPNTGQSIPMMDDYAAIHWFHPPPPAGLEVCDPNWQKVIGLDRLPARPS